MSRALHAAVTEGTLGERLLRGPVDPQTKLADVLSCRKGTLLLNNVFSIVPAILMGCSEVAKSFEMIIVSRFLVGICAGERRCAAPRAGVESSCRCGRGEGGAEVQTRLGGVSEAQTLQLSLSCRLECCLSPCARLWYGQQARLPAMCPVKKAAL